MSDEVEIIEAPIEEETTAPAEEQGENTSESVTDEETAPPEAPKPNGVQRRIDRLTREKADAAREAEFWRQQALRVAPPATAPVTETPKDTGEPKEDDFATAADYVKAVAQHTYEQGVKAEREAREKREQEQAQTALQKTVQERLNSYRAVHPEFDEDLADAAFNTSPLMAHELQDSEIGPAILHFFAHHPAEANRIAELTDPRKVAKEVAKIEVRLSSAPAAVKPAPTTTPPPLKPVAASRQAVADIGKIDDDAEYFRQLRASRK